LACEDGSLVFKRRLSGAAKIRLPGYVGGAYSGREIRSTRS